MTAIALRKKLTNYIQFADIKKVKAMYALLENDLKEKVIVSAEQYNEELTVADKEISKGNFIAHKDVVKRFENRKATKK